MEDGGGGGAVAADLTGLTRTSALCRPPSRPWSSRVGAAEVARVLGRGSPATPNPWVSVWCAGLVSAPSSSSPSPPEFSLPLVLLTGGGLGVAGAAVAVAVAVAVVGSGRFVATRTVGAVGRIGVTGEVWVMTRVRTGAPPVGSSDAPTSPAPAPAPAGDVAGRGPGTAATVTGGGLVGMATPCVTRAAFGSALVVSARGCRRARISSGCSG